MNNHQIDFIRASVPYMNDEQIAEKLSISAKSVYNARSKMNLIRKRGKRLDRDKIATCMEMISVGLTIDACARYLCVSRSFIQHVKDEYMSFKVKNISTMTLIIESEMNID